MKSQASGNGQLTKYGKQQIALAQFERGCAFVGAALLTKRCATNEPQQYVFLHLICQGLELVLKGVLLAKDYDEYRPREKKFGHCVEKLTKEALEAFRLKPLNPKLEAEVKYLASRFGEHRLRYASAMDIYIAPSSIEYGLILRRLGAAVRLSKRHLSKL